MSAYETKYTFASNLQIMLKDYQLKQLKSIPKVSKKILLVEHDLTKKRRLISYLNKQNHEVIWANTGLTGLDRFQNEYFDLVIIDKALPYKDAYSLLRSIKNSYRNTPAILIVSEKDTNNNTTLEIRYDGFENEFEQILKQPDTFLSKNNTPKQNIHKHQIGAYELDSKFRILTYNNKQRTKISPKESKMLKILIENKGNLVTKELLLKKVWYNDEAINLKSIGVYVTKLRKLLQKDPKIKILNVYKVGFILTD